jgi:hypothetical protein
MWDYFTSIYQHSDGDDVDLTASAESSVPKFMSTLHYPKYVIPCKFCTRFLNAPLQKYDMSPSDAANSYESNYQPHTW